MTQNENKVKDSKDITSSIKRIAYQVYEANLEEECLIIVGIGKRGSISLEGLTVWLLILIFPFLHA